MRKIIMKYLKILGAPLFLLLQFFIGQSALAVTSATTLNNPLTGGTVSTSIPELVNKIIKAGFGIVGTAALVIFIYGGILWMTAMGEEKRIKQGWDTMVWAGLGMIRMFGSYALVDFVLNAIAQPTAA